MKEFDEHLKKLQEEERQHKEEKEAAGPATSVSSAPSKAENKDQKNFDKFKQEVANKLAKALYFACYFHEEQPQSEQLIQFIKRSKDEEFLQVFKQEVKLFEDFVKMKHEACLETK